jgi:hypothetical protein
MPTDVQLTTPGMVLGSPHFISPERAMGSDFGPPSDLFSLGVTLYTAVEGRPPFDKGDPIETMHAVVEDPPAPTSRAGSLNTVLMGLLEKDPAQRFDVPTARTMLRQQLAGPLASKAPPHMMTDPYAVVPTQRPPAAETQPIPPKPTGQIGGPAMLAPGESLTGRLAKLRQSGRPRPTADDTAVVPPTGAYQAPTAGPSTGAHQAPGTDSDRTSVLPPNAPRSGPPNAPTSGGGDTTAVVPPRAAWDGSRAARESTSGTVVQSPAARRRAMIDKTVRTARETGTRVVTTVRGWPRNLQLAAGGAGLAVVVLLGVVIAFSGGEEPPPKAQKPSGQQPVPASFATQDHKAKGVTVKVPKDWKRTSGGNWVDYADPEDSKRKVRILVETGTAEPRRFAERIAENTLKGSKNCPKPYKRVAVTDVEVAGHPGAQLEYTCGSGEGMRHGIWRETTVGGKMYSFYLTATDAQFAESKPFFDEMTRTFALDAS